MNISLKWLKLYVVLACLIFSLAVEANEISQKTNGAKLDEVVVTATRTDSILGKIGGTSATVITAQDIEAKQQTTVEEVLKGVPGLDIVANGGPGTMSSVFTRGADSKNTLILIDGIMFNDPSGSNRGADLANLTVDNIERIEVVRGPLSVLYGSNATAGVINIITKKGKGKPTAYAGAEGGSYGTWKTYGGVSGSIGKSNYSLSASKAETDGFSIANDDNDRIPHSGNTSEDDGWENLTLSGKVGYEFTNDFDIQAVIRYLDSEVETDDWGPGYTGDRFDGYPYTANPTGTKEQRTESEQFFGKVNLHNYFFERFFESTLAYQISDHERQSYENDGSQSYDYEGKTREASWQGTLNFSDMNYLTAGAAYFEEEMESQSSSIINKEADTKSIWIQDQFIWGQGFDIIVGIRRDDHSKFGSKSTYRFAPAYTIEKTNTTLKASYGTGFRAPSLFELYSSYGSETLKPEESKGWDIGFEQSFANERVRFGVNYFDMVFDNRIGFNMTTWLYDQLEGDTKVKGVESFVSWMPTDDLNFTLNYTYNDTEDPNGNKLVRRPENKVHLNTNYRFLQKAMVNLDFFWVGDREANSSSADMNGNSVETLGAYTVVNLSASYDVTNHIKIYGNVDNVFDEEYEEAWSYATPGRSAYVGMKFTY